MAEHKASGPCPGQAGEGKTPVSGRKPQDPLIRGPTTPGPHPLPLSAPGQRPQKGHISASSRQHPPGRPQSRLSVQPNSLLGQRKPTSSRSHVLPAPALSRFSTARKRSESMPSLCLLSTDRQPRSPLSPACYRPQHLYRYLPNNV